MDWIVVDPDTGKTEVVTATHEEMDAAHENPQLLRDKISARRSAEADKAARKAQVEAKSKQGVASEADILQAFTGEQRQILKSLLSRIESLETALYGDFKRQGKA